MVKLVLHKVDLQWLQKNGFIGSEQVAILWEQLTQKCPNLPSEGENNEVQTTVELDLPSITGAYLGEHPRTDICVAYSLKNGEKLASRIMDGISKQSAKTATLAFRPDAPFDPAEVEKNVATAGSLVVLLTQDCLRQVEVVYSMLVAKFYYQHPSLVILVHDAESCAFPGYDEQPASVKDFFSEKAITFLGCYPEEGIEEILAKFDTEMHVLDNILKNFRQRPSDALLHFLTKNEHRKEFAVKEIAHRMKDFMTPQQLQDFVEAADSNKDGTISQMEIPELISKLRQQTAGQKPEEQHHEVEETEDITTRVFLSHKRSTGQGIAGRFYEGLKLDYRVFIDSEAKFKIHNLKAIVQNTDAFVFLLTYGIMLSKWCLEELKSAIANNKRVIIVRELSYVLPDVLPPEWQEVETVLRTSPELVWLAEYNSACVKALKKFIGSPDDHWKPTLKASAEPGFSEVINKIIQKAQTTGTYDFNAEIAVPENDAIFADAVLDLVLRQVPATEIKRIQMKPYLTTTSDVLKYLILQLPHLENVDINSDRLDTGVLKNISHRLIGLNRLRLQNATITDESIKYLVRHNARMTELELVECKSLTQAALDLAVQLPRLQRLTVVDSITNAVEPTSKVASTDLQYLEIYNSGVGDSALNVFHNLPSLKELRLSSLYNVTPAGLETLLRSLPNLLKVQLSRNRVVNEQVVSALIAQHSNILALDISYNVNISSSSLLSLFSSCHAVQELNLAGLAVDDKMLPQIVEGCPDLKNLNIRLAFNITSLEPLAALKHLKELHISSSRALSNDKYAENHKDVQVCVSTDAYDISSGWSFYPAVVVGRKDGQVLVHTYGIGDERWMEETETESLVEFHTREDQYGSLDVVHTSSSCNTCAALHSQCRGDVFNGTMNMFFINEDFEKWSYGTEVANQIVSSVKTCGEFYLNNYELQRMPALRVETIAKYVIKQVGDIHTIKSISISELKELEIAQYFPYLEGVTITSYFTDYDNWAERLREAIPNIKKISFVSSSGRNSHLVFEMFPDLESIRLDAYWGDAQVEKLPQLTKLQHLDITNMEGISAASLKLIGQLTQLKTLLANGVKAISDDTFSLLYPLENLEHLTVARTSLSEKGFANFKDHFLKLTKFQADFRFAYDEAVCKSILENHAALEKEWTPKSAGDLSGMTDVLDTVQKWYPASIVDQNEKQIKIHYYGWGSKFDEWLDRTSPRVAPPLSHSHEYGKQGSAHPREECEHCPKLHGICKDLQFGGGPNVFFQ